MNAYMQKEKQKIKCSKLIVLTENTKLESCVYVLSDHNKLLCIEYTHKIERIYEMNIARELERYGIELNMANPIEVAEELNQILFKSEFSRPYK